MKRDARGQALPEFVLVVPILLLCVLATFDIARVVWAQTNIAHAAREGVRLAIVHGGSWANACPIGPPAPDASVPAPSSSCPYPSPSKQAVVEHATRQLVGALSNPTVAVCYGAGCSGNTDATGANNAPGTEVSVVVSGSVDLVAARLLGMTRFDISTKATMIISR